MLALLVLGALALYYPLVALAAVNAVFGHGTTPRGACHTLPPWARAAGARARRRAGGAAPRDHPGTRGHGVPEVVAAVEREPRGAHRAARAAQAARLGAITIGTGGSAGREGPIVYGGAAFGSAVGRTLGFTRRELSILLAGGAGAGIAASFNAPIAGAIFALEIILREFELTVFSPIILASVTATLVGRGVMGNAAMLDRVPYQLVSGWEILAYAALGLVYGAAGLRLRPAAARERGALRRQAPGRALRAGSDGSRLPAAGGARRAGGGLPWRSSPDGVGHGARVAQPGGRAEADASRSSSLACALKLVATASPSAAAARAAPSSPRR